MGNSGIATAIPAWRPPRKVILIGSFSLIYLGTLIYIIDLGETVSVFGRLPATTLAVAAVLVILSNLFALARSGTVLSALGFRLGWRDLLIAFAAGNVSNLPLNVVGQSLTRAMVLVRAGIPSGATIMATYVERFLAAGLLFFFSLVSLWLLFGRIDFDIHRGGGEILSTIAGMTVVCGAVALTVFRRDIMDHFGSSARWLLRLGPSAVLTILCHASGLGAYIILLDGLGLGGLSVGVVAALIIVMFVTSLPISFAGWGLRELSAASTLGLIGISPEISVAAALSIGLLFLGTTGLFGGLSLAFLNRRRRTMPMGQAEPAGGQGVSIGRDWDAKTLQVCAVLCSVLLFFRVPTRLGGSDAAINVNVADIVVFLGLSVILLMIAADRIKILFPRFLNTALAGISAVILLGLLVSFARDNVGTWALYTRGVGWILMLGYAALGAAMVCVAGDRGRVLVMRTMIVAAMAVCALQLAVLAWSSLISVVPHHIVTYPIEGFANNENAFSFELTMIGVLLITARHIGLFGDSRWRFPLAIAILTLAIFFTESRTGAVFVVVLAVLDGVLGRYVAGGRGSRTTLFAAAAIIGVTLLPYIVRFTAPALSSLIGIGIDSESMFTTLAKPHPDTGHTRLLHTMSDNVRWDTIVGGLKLWTDRPFLGAGLGAYIESLKGTGQKIQGIHSVYVWFLVEMGVAGLAAAVGSVTLIAVKGWRMMLRPETGPWGFAVVAAVAFMAVGGLVQDFFFQRIFWFVLGLMAARGARIAN